VAAGNAASLGGSRNLLETKTFTAFDGVGLFRNRLCLWKVRSGPKNFAASSGALSHRRTRCIPYTSSCEHPLPCTRPEMPQAAFLIGRLVQPNSAKAIFSFLFRKSITDADAHISACQLYPCGFFGFAPSPPPGPCCGRHLRNNRGPPTMTSLSDFKNSLLQPDVSGLVCPPRKLATQFQVDGRLLPPKYLVGRKDILDRDYYRDNK